MVDLFGGICLEKLFYLIDQVGLGILLSGLAVFLGASKADKIRSAWFFAATIFATIWTIAISLFLIATPNWNGALTLIVDMTYISAIFIDIALLGYISFYFRPYLCGSIHCKTRITIY